MDALQGCKMGFDGRKKEDAVSWARSRVRGLENPSSLLQLLFEKRAAAVFMVALFVLMFFFWSQLKVLAVMAFFIALGAVSMLYNRWVRVSLGFELVMLGLVITAVAFGRLAGLVVGFTGLFLAEVLSGRFTHSTFVSFIGLAVVGLAAPNAFGILEGNITLTGILLTVIYDAVIAPGYVILGSNPGRTGLFVVTHLAFNAWVFSFAAPLILRLLD